MLASLWHHLLNTRRYSTVRTTGPSIAGTAWRVKLLLAITENSQNRSVSADRNDAERACFEQPSSNRILANLTTVLRSRDAARAVSSDAATSARPDEEAAPALGQDLLNDVAMDVGQAAVDAVVADRSAACDRCPAGAGSWRAGRSSRSGSSDFQRPLVALAVGDARLDAGAGQPGDERAAVVVAAGGALAEGHAAELGGPDRRACRRTGRGPSRSLSSAGDGLSVARAMGGSSLAMLVWLSQLSVGPAGAAPDLHEAHAALEQPAGDQAVAAEGRGRLVVQAVELVRRGGLAARGRAPRAR